MSARRAALEAIRDKLAAELQDCFGRDAAVIAKELRATWSELDAIPEENSQAPTDEIAKRREDRRRKAAGE